MNTIKILTKRVPIKSEQLGELIDFTSRLNLIIKKQDGFVKSKTFVHNFETLYVLSEWDNINNWNKCNESHDINKYMILYKSLYLQNENIELRDVQYNDIFLL
jgi:hypothetical protein